MGQTSCTRRYTCPCISRVVTLGFGMFVLTRHLCFLLFQSVYSRLINMRPIARSKMLCSPLSFKLVPSLNMAHKIQCTLEKYHDGFLISMSDSLIYIFNSNKNFYLVSQRVVDVMFYCFQSIVNMIVQTCLDCLMMIMRGISNSYMRQIRRCRKQSHGNH